MKEIYVNAELDVVEFAQSDIISTSGCDFELPRDDEE